MYRDLPSATPSELPNAVKAANEISCPPIYPHLDNASVQLIINSIKAT
jgi:dTDP-4-amino-4,6-dideoxygalactose transaminase